MGPKETKCVALLHGPWGFRKCIWEPWVTKSKLHSKFVLPWLDFSVKIGLSNPGLPYTFLESPGSIEYCYVNGFLGPHESLPWLRLKYAVRWVTHLNLSGGSSHNKVFRRWEIIMSSNLYWKNPTNTIYDYQSVRP